MRYILFLVGAALVILAVVDSHGPQVEIGALAFVGILLVFISFFWKKRVSRN